MTFLELSPYLVVGALIIVAAVLIARNIIRMVRRQPVSSGCSGCSGCSSYASCAAKQAAGCGPVDGGPVDGGQADRGQQSK